MQTAFRNLVTALVCMFVVGHAWSDDAPGTNLMQGEVGGSPRDATPDDFVPVRDRPTGCRTFSSEGTTVGRFTNSRLLTARPHAELRLGPGQHYCVSGFLVGRNLRVRIVGRDDGWFKAEVGSVSGWIETADLKREL